MSPKGPAVTHGSHRKPRTKTKTPRLRRLAAGLGIAAAAATGALIADHALTPQSDTTWGAPDTDPTLTLGVDTGTDTGITGGVTVTPLDTTWG